MWKTTRTNGHSTSQAQIFSDHEKVKLQMLAIHQHGRAYSHLGEAPGDTVEDAGVHLRSFLPVEEGPLGVHLGDDVVGVDDLAHKTIFSFSFLCFSLIMKGLVQST
jgi:hypothetical protein